MRIRLGLGLGGLVGLVFLSRLVSLVSPLFVGALHNL